MSLSHARWLGNAAAVAGGCVAVNDEGREAAQIIGYDCIGRVPESWDDANYNLLTNDESERVRLYLSITCSGWSGAKRINQERKDCLKMLGFSPVG